MMKASGLVALLVSVLTLGGCMSNSSSAGHFGVGEARNELRVRFGVVEAVSTVDIAPEGEGGSTVGGLLGAIGGSAIGDGRGSAAAAVLGAAVGSAIGQKVQQSADRRVGLQIVVRFENGRVSAFVQDADPTFALGEKVLVITSRSGTARVTKLDQTATTSQ